MLKIMLPCAIEVIHSARPQDKRNTSKHNVGFSTMGVKQARIGTSTWLLWCTAASEVMFHSHSMVAGGLEEMS